MYSHRLDYSYWFIIYRSCAESIDAALNDAKLALVPRDSVDDASAIIEIRAGAANL